MKRYKYILFVLFSILACQSEIDQNENTNENAIPMSFYAGIEIPKDPILTKTVLDGSSSDAFRNVLWEYQDEVYVTNGSQSAKFINTSQGTSEIALLEGQLAEGANYFAAYPFNIVTNSSLSSFTVDLPSEQRYCADGIASEAFPMVAQCEEGVFNFKNICGILVVQLLGEQTVTSITFSGKDPEGNSLPVAGSGNVSLDYSDVPTLVMESLSDTSVSLLCSTGVKLSTTNPTTFHIVLPSGTYDTFDLTIGAKDGSKMVVNSSKSLSIKRSQRTTAAALTYVDVIDLSSAGTANCYIVSKTGKYKFNASVKGNSQESVGTVEAAEVLWESFGTDATPSVGDIVRNVSYKDGYIELETPSPVAEGNAVIAAKDASGTILWSWHIWVTDQPDELVYLNNIGIMMDRNLGAISTTPGDVGALGLLYQWGRKDPFVGVGNIGAKTPAKMTIDGHEIGSEWGLDELTESINYPSKFIYNGEGSYNWMDNKDYKSLWGYESTKEIYDPCPTGYRVPSREFWENTVIKSADYSYDETLNGFNYSYGSGITWYPAILCRSSDGLFQYSFVGSYWSCIPSSASFSYKACTLKFDDTTYGIRAFYENRGSARAVRCVKE